MQKRISLAGAFALALTGAAGAEQDTGDDQGVVVLDTITVTTPLRRESSLERSTSSVTVIDEAEIRRSAALDLPSLLRSVAGLSINQSGGMGSRTGVSIRGAKPQQTLVLINGVNIKGITAGEASIFNIPLDAVERIEIAKGAHSAQYGSDAIGGVINIITRSGGNCGKDICTTVSAGVSHPWGGHAGVRVGGTAPDGATFSLGGRVIGTRGYDFTTPGNPDNEPDDDGFLQGSLDFAYDKELGWGAIHASGLYARSRNQYDATPLNWTGQPNPNEADNDLFAGKVGVRIDHTEDWLSRVEFSTALDHQKNFRRGTTANDVYGTTRYGIAASTQRTFDLGAARNVLILGAEAFHEKVDSTVAYNVTARDLAAGYAQYSLEFSGLTVDAGVRYDHNSQFGGATTYNLGASYQIVPGLTARASHGTGFRAPTFNDLYWPVFGNPNLQPETSKTYEIGLRWQPTADTVLDIAYYDTRLRNFFDPVAGGGVVNVDAARIRGVEVSLAHHFNERWYGAATLDLREPKDLTNGLDLLRQERVRASLEVGFRPIEKLNLAARVLFGGKRPDTDPVTFGRITVPSYTTLDLTAIYSFDENSDLKVSVENLFDKNYTTTAGYRSPGRTVNVSYTKTF